MGPLNIKTQYSLLASMIKIPALIDYAKEHHYEALAITDDNMFGVMEFYNACLMNQIKPIIGLDVKIDDHNLLLYAKNELGYHELIKISTTISEGKLNLDYLKQHNQALIAIVPFKAKNYYQTYDAIYDDLYQGYDNEMEKKQLTGDNLVYINPIYYLEAADKPYYPFLEAIRKGISVKEVVNDHQDHYLIDQNYDDANNQKIIAACQVTIQASKDLLPVFDCPNQLDSYSYLKQLCKEGLKRLFGNQVKRAYVDRLKYELEIINQMGFANYFLVVADYVKYAKDHGILVGPGRGSAAGSLVSYCLNITSIDPLKYNLLFERFLNPERITMPDIDIDFEFNRREEVINYCIQKYGLKRVVGIITFGTLASKQVMRDVGKALDIDLKTIDHITKMIDAKQSLADNYHHNPQFKAYIDNNPDMQNLFKIASKLEGLKRHTSIHAAGIIMSNQNLDDIIPLNYNHEGFYTTAYSMEYLEPLGLLKMDFLALRNLTLITETLDALKVDGINLTFDDIPMNDPLALNVFTTVNTKGIFQFESEGMMAFLAKLKPTTFEDIAAAIALFRPGPMANIDLFIKRKHGQVKYQIPEPLKAILAPTYGIMIYQEQIMQVSVIMASFSLAKADILRKAISKKKEHDLMALESSFISGCEANGYSEAEAQKTYNLVLKFGGYGFNRAHSVAYSMIAYRMAYLKAHYPKYFMKSLLTMVMGSEIKTKEYLYECKLNQITLLKPDINLSGYDYQIEALGIRYPLGFIKKVGLSSVQAIMKERANGPYKDIYDFVARTDNLNKSILTSLIDAGVFNTFGLNKKTLHHNLDRLINYGELAKNLSANLVERPELELMTEYSPKELMSLELATFGFYLSNNPVTEYRERYQTVALKDIDAYFDKVVEVVINVDKIKEITTKKNDKMFFMTGSDELKTIDLVIFPDHYELALDVKVGDLLLVKAKVEQRLAKKQLVVIAIKELNN